MAAVDSMAEDTSVAVTIGVEVTQGGYQIAGFLRDRFCLENLRQVTSYTL